MALQLPENDHFLQENVERTYTMVNFFEEDVKRTSTMDHFLEEYVERTGTFDIFLQDYVNRTQIIEFIFKRNSIPRNLNYQLIKIIINH